MKSIKKMFLHLKKKTILTIIILSILFIAMLFLRIIPFYHEVFTNWPGPHGPYVNFAIDDPVYQMRLVHNTINHFPFRIFFDPYTHFPYGSQVHVGPLWSLLIASLSLIAGLGNPSAQLIDKIGAYFPVFFGAICLIPVYFLGKRFCGGRLGGIATSIIFAFFPGSFFDRSRLGYTDHHVAEVFFSTLMLLFFIYALDIDALTTIKKIKIKLNKNRKKIFYYASLSGLCGGFYLLSWPAAPLFFAIIFIFLFAQMIRNHWQYKTQNNLAIIALPVFTIPIIMTLPYVILNPTLQLNYFSLTQPLVLLFMMTLLGLSFALSKILNHIKISKFFYPLFLGGAIFIASLIAFILNENFAQVIIGGIKMLFKPLPGMRTVGEMTPLFYNYSGKLDLMLAKSHFFWTLPISIIGIILLLIPIAKEKEQRSILFFIWSTIIFFATISQIRFAYYYAINSSILTTYVFYFALLKLDIKSYQKSFLKKVKSRYTFLKFLKKHHGKTLIFIEIAILFFIIALYPLFMPESSSGAILRYKKIAPNLNVNNNYIWFNTLMWMKNHTPIPGKESKELDYKHGYYKIPKNKDRIYKYDPSAYGIMNWWDMGHMITYLAERIPVSNPFQQGIIEKDGSGSANFFVSENEREALSILEKTRARYIVIDNAMLTNKFYSILAWLPYEKDKKVWHENIFFPIKKEKIKDASLNIDSKKYKNTISYKLYYKDGNYLDCIRLVYESTGYYFVDANFLTLIDGKLISSHLNLREKNYEKALSYYKQGAKPSWINKNVIIYNAHPPAKPIKIFEKVKGAIIAGKTKSKKEVELTLFLKTNQGREFTYEKSTFPHKGEFRFTVPYPTQKIEGEGYSSDVKAISPYIIKTGTLKHRITVKEEDVIKGNVLHCY